MRYIYCFFLLLLTSCLPYYHHPQYPHQEYAHEVLNDFMERQVSQDAKLEVCCTGGGVHETIRSLCGGFFYKEILSLEDLRVLFVKLNEDFRYCVNTHLKEYLEIYPAPADEFEMEIFITDSKGRKPPSGLPCYVGINRGRVLYFSMTPNPIPGARMLTLHEESYEDAWNIVREHHPEVLPPDYLLPEERAKAMAPLEININDSTPVMIPNIHPTS
jgi:hypothetical protein